MITEVAFMTVHAGQEEQFLAALAEARKVVAQAKGFQGIDVKRGIERPSTFMLTLTWNSLEDHTERFRGGPLFAEWRGHIGPFFAEAPQVEHWTAS